MQHQFNEAAARASARAVNSVEALSLALGLRLGMLRSPPGQTGLIEDVLRDC